MTAETLARHIKRGAMSIFDNIAPSKKVSRHAYASFIATFHDVANVITETDTDATWARLIADAARLTFADDDVIVSFLCLTSDAIRRDADDSSEASEVANEIDRILRDEYSH